MIYPVCAIRDAKTGFFPPQMEQNIDSAKRNFSMVINSGEGLIAYQPSDFDFYHVADFDSEKGEMVAVFPIEQIATGIGVFNEK